MSELNGQPSISSSTNTYGAFSNKNTIIIVLLVLLILSMLGINLLQITGNLFNDIANPLVPIVKSILSTIGFITGNIIKGSADIIADTVDVGVDIAKGTTHTIGDLLINSTNPGEIDYSKQISLSEVIGIPKLQIVSANPIQSTEPTVNPISAQKPKAGWCYVGNYKGVKGCIEVTEHDKCMSGQIFPNKESCFNPNSNQ